MSAPEMVPSAESPAPQASPAAQSPAKPENKLKLQGLVDTYYAYNFNRPLEGANFIAGIGTSGKRHDEFSLNLASLDLALDPQPVGVRLILAAGSAAELVHSAEPTGDGIGRDVWRHVQQASIAYRIGQGRGLLLEAGIFPCHAGFESFPSKDNWNYTRSWMAEFSPYYVSGIKGSYSFGAHWSAQLHLLNGWQTIGETNHSKTLGTQLAWSGERLSVSFNTLLGHELPWDDEQWRTYGDLVVVYKLSEGLSLGASLDAAREGRANGEDVSWKAAAGYARYAQPQAKWAVALRGEVFDDPHAGISGWIQRLSAGTMTFELRPADRLIFKVEGRSDHSDRSVFQGVTEGEEPRLQARPGAAGHGCRGDLLRAAFGSGSGGAEGPRGPRCPLAEESASG
jgi:hypothetical protein